MIKLGVLSNKIGYFKIEKKSNSEKVIGKKIVMQKNCNKKKRIFLNIRNSFTWGKHKKLLQQPIRKWFKNSLNFSLKIIFFV